MNKILLVGCGNIGSRHLQGIVKLKTNLDITIVEPVDQSIRLAKQRLNGITFKKTHKIKWTKSFSDINSPFDLCIISTNSDIRLSIISKLLKMKNKKFLVEKMVCQSKNDYSKLEFLFKKNKAKCWVNTSRRLFNFYRKLKKFPITNPLVLNITGGEFGLGSNSIHFIDLFCWICNSTKINLSGNNLHEKILNNKRGKQFLEFSGTIHGNINDKFFINIVSVPKSTLPIQLTFIGKKFHITVNETDQLAYKFENNKQIKLFFKKELTSDTSTEIVSDILYTNNCALPSLEFLRIPHYELFRIFNSHIYKIKKQRLLKCPIT